MQFEESFTVQLLQHDNHRENMTLKGGPSLKENALA